MAISRPKLIAFILAAVFAATAAPRAASPAPPLTLDQLTKMAMENNPGYKASLETLHAASETVGIEKSAYFPNVGFHFGYQRFATHLFLPDAVNRIPGFSAAVGPFDRWGTSVQASYTLFDSGRRKSKLTAARDLQAASRQGTEWDRQDLLFSVHQAYYSLLAARERVTVAEQSLSRSEAHLKLAQARREEGAAPLADVLRTRVEVSNAKVEVVQAQSRVRVTRGALNILVGRSPDSSLSVAEPPPVEGGGRPRTDLSPLMRRALSDRADLKAAAERIKARAARVNTAKSAYGPTISLEGSYGRLDQAFFPMDKDWAVGAVIKVPIFAGFERRHMLAQARSELRGARLQEEQLQLKVRQEVWTAVQRVREAFSTVSETKTMQADAEESLRMARERYAVGAGTITDLLDAETNLAGADFKHVKALYDYRVARAELKRTVGAL
jgi:outer membrane protein